MELRKPLLLTIVAAAAGAALARAVPTAVPMSTTAVASMRDGASNTASWDGAAAGLHSATRPVADGEDRTLQRKSSSSGVRVGALPTETADSSARSGRASGAVVYVAGEVARPGVYTLTGAARAVDALQAAGGPTRAADLVAVNLAQRVEDGAEIFVPPKGAVPPEAVAAADMPTDATPRRSRSRHAHRRKRRKRMRSSAYDGQTAPAMAAPVSLNAADAAELQTLPGIGPALAERIVAFREVNGPFASTDELLDVGGMTQSKVDALAPWLTIR